MPSTIRRQRTPFATVLVGLCLATTDTSSAFASPDDQARKLVAAIDIDADPLHTDFTPAVARLIALGVVGGRAVTATLRSAPRSSTRLRAQRVLEGVILGWHKAAARRQTKELFRSHGRPEQRLATRRSQAQQLWRQWLGSRVPERCVCLRGLSLRRCPGPPTCPVAMMGRRWHQSLQRTLRALVSDPQTPGQEAAAARIPHFGVLAAWALIYLPDTIWTTLGERVGRTFAWTIAEVLARQEADRARATVRRIGYHGHASKAKRHEAVSRFEDWLSVR
jgi:hypothetical protein